MSDREPLRYGRDSRPPRRGSRILESGRSGGFVQHGCERLQMLLFVMDSRIDTSQFDCCGLSETGRRTSGGKRNDRWHIVAAQREVRARAGAGSDAMGKALGNARRGCQATAMAKGHAVIPALRASRERRTPGIDFAKCRIPKTQEGGMRLSSRTTATANMSDGEFADRTTPHQR